MFVGQCQAFDLARVGPASAHKSAQQTMRLPRLKCYANAKQ